MKKQTFILPLLALGLAFFLLQAMGFRESGSNKKGWSLDNYPHPIITRICIDLPVATLKKVKSKADGTVYLNVYPFKKTANQKLNDFSLAVFYQGGKNDSVSLGEPINTKLLKTQIANYYAYLAAHHVDQSAVPFAYRFIADSILEKNGEKKTIRICIDVPAQYKDATTHLLPTAATRDTSACRCPPECPCRSTEMTRELPTLLNNVYKQSEKSPASTRKQ